jgi:HD superfamily phosphohydrolase
MITIHDPIHGTIEVSPAEIKIIDSQPFQRLRHIRQLGLAEMAFPGATHSRYAHSLGAMQMATRMADQILPTLGLGGDEQRRIRQTVRLAVLLHDIGHPPLSHVSERVMPPLSALGLPAPWADEPGRQATHEDYTIKLLVDSELTELIERGFGAMGVTGARLAALVAASLPPDDADAFIVGGLDLFPLLSQIVSGELDADRMDYLRRDAYYCGVSYGQFDHEWLTASLSAVEYERRWALALQHKGVWAFENFLLARYHMFLAVYYHHSPICFDHLLTRYFESGEYRLPPDSGGYLETDDVHLLSALRASDNRWARYVVRRRSYRLLVETHDYGENSGDAALDRRLRDADVDFFRVRSQGVLSKYFKRRERVFPLIVLEPELGRQRRVEDYTPLYRRFEDVAGIVRIYCHPDHYPRARQLLAQAQADVREEH